MCSCPFPNTEHNKKITDYQPSNVILFLFQNQRVVYQFHIIGLAQRCSYPSLLTGLGLNQFRYKFNNFAKATPWGATLNASVSFTPNSAFYIITKSSTSRNFYRKLGQICPTTQGFLLFCFHRR